MVIRQASDRDAGRIAEIYKGYVLQTIVSFETEAVTVGEMKKRIKQKLARFDWLVGELDGEIVGYAYYGPFRPRAAYDHTVESTIYLAPQSTGKGYGAILYGELMASAARRGFREAIGVIALPNPQSIALHRKVGFEEVGVLKKVGYKFGKYIDVGLWQMSTALPPLSARR